MHIIKNIKILKRIVKKHKDRGENIGFVPTMGYLHKGHLSLVRIARKRCKFVVVSIFVNPTQFGPHEDLCRYPRDLKRDVAFLKKEGVDVIFYPSVRAMYPYDYKTYVKVHDMSSILCGVRRPHHFQGVTTVVLKLFNIVEPDIAVFGQKDYQQVVVIKRMVRDLNLDIKVITGKIIREKDGLAMSSRNTYLLKKQRKHAVVLYQSLRWLKKVYHNGLTDPKKALKKIRGAIQQKGGKIDYVEALDKDTLEPVKKIKKGTLICLAVCFGKTRLIDNTLL